MPPRIRVALIDDDSGLVTVLDRRFAALGWDREVLALRGGARAAGRDASARADRQSGADRPRLHRADRGALPGLAMLVCSGPAPVADRVRALRGGADDWSPSRAIPRSWSRGSRRSCAAAAPASCPVEDEPVTRGELTIRPDRFDAYAGGRPRRCRARSTSCCYQLATAGGRVLEREEIYQRVWGYTMVRGDRSVDVFVRKLRQKLERISPELALRAHALRRRLPVRRRANRWLPHRPRRRRGGGVLARQDHTSSVRLRRRTVNEMTTVRNILIVLVLAALVAWSRADDGRVVPSRPCLSCSWRRSRGSPR